jgi:hypothetical protein
MGGKSATDSLPTRSSLGAGRRSARCRALRKAAGDRPDAGIAAYTGIQFRAVALNFLIAFSDFPHALALLLSLLCLGLELFPQACPFFFRQIAEATLNSAQLLLPTSLQLIETLKSLVYPLLLLRSEILEPLLNSLRRLSLLRAHL